MVHAGEICSPRGTEGRGSVGGSMRRMAQKELDKDDPAILLKKRMFCSIHLGGSDQSNDLGHNDLGSNDLAPEVQAMFFVTIIWVTIISEAIFFFPPA